MKYFRLQQSKENHKQLNYSKQSFPINQIMESYTVRSPISLNNYLDFSSMPPFLVFSLFVHMNVRDVSENRSIEMQLGFPRH